MRLRNKSTSLIALLIPALVLGVFNHIDKRQLFEFESANNDLSLAAEGIGVAGGDLRIADAFRNGRSNVQLGGEGRVVRVLSDDNKGSRHQRLLIELASGHTLLIAHNIDLAPRIKNLREGDVLEFYGEYEWNAKGGVIHWTHHDPKGKHPGGWLKHQGQVYQ